MKIEIEFKDLEARIDEVLARKLDQFYEKIIDRLPARQIKFYRPRDVSDLLGFDIQTVYKWIKQGKLKAETIGKNKTISDADLDTFIKENPRFKLKQKKAAK